MEISAFFCHSHFTWNQFFKILQDPKCYFLQYCGLWILIFGQFHTSQCAKTYKNQISEILNVLKKLISRKILVAEKFCNFHTVGNTAHKSFFPFIGNATRLCDATGQWTGSEPKCRPIACGDPVTLPHTTVALINGSTSWKAVAQYSCIFGFHSSGKIS